MPPASPFRALFSRSCTGSQPFQPFNLPQSNLRIPLPNTTIQVRTVTGKGDNAAKYKRSDNTTVRKKRVSTHFKQPDLRKAEQFALVDAMRYIRAFEVGQSPTNIKYELHVRMKSAKSGLVVRNRLRLPHSVDSSTRVCVIAAPDSKAAAAAKAAGAVLVGEDSVFEVIRAGKLEFERCLCHHDSIKALAQSGVARILGPRGLMPNLKTGTVVKDVAAAMKETVGGSEYRERAGVVRMAIGQLRFTPEEMQRNIKAFMDSIKNDCSRIGDRGESKDIHEVVLSSTNAPGFSLNGDFRSLDSIPTSAMATL